MEIFVVLEMYEIIWRVVIFFFLVFLCLFVYLICKFVFLLLFIDYVLCGYKINKYKVLSRLVIIFYRIFCLVVGLEWNMVLLVSNIDYIFSKEVNCFICLEEYVELKVLFCFYNICKKCLKELLYYYMLSFCCLICCVVCLIFDCGVDGFLINDYLVCLIWDLLVKKVI